MCGRYYIDDDETISEMRRIFREIDAKFNSSGNSSGREDTSKNSASVPEPRSMLKTGEIFPTNIAPVLLGKDNGMVPVPMYWGFPRPGASGVIINARAETAAEKPMFARAVRGGRCLIPTNGFYEWSHDQGEAKKKYLLSGSSSHMLYLAGLFAMFDKKDDVSLASFVILTVAANDSVRPLHDRMPLVIEASEKRGWLTDESFARERLLAPCASHLTRVLLS